jgi:hypothetical protein
MIKKDLIKLTFKLICCDKHLFFTEMNMNSITVGDHLLYCHKKLLKIFNLFIGWVFDNLFDSC